MLHFIMVIAAIFIGVFSTLFAGAAIFGKTKSKYKFPLSPKSINDMDRIVRQFLFTIGAYGICVAIALASLNFLEAVGAITLLTLALRHIVLKFKVKFDSIKANDARDERG